MFAGGYAIGKVTKCAGALAGAVKNELKAVSKLSKELQASASVATNTIVETAEIAALTAEHGATAVGEALETVGKNPTLISEAGCSTAKAVEKVVQQGTGAVKKSAGRIAQESGKAFEEFLVDKLGGKGSFVAKSTKTSREFDGAIRNIWYEAKSGKYWEKVLNSKKYLEKFYSDMGRGLEVTRAHGAIYELHSNSIIPKDIKKWLTKNGIKFTEWL